MPIDPEEDHTRHRKRVLVSVLSFLFAMSKRAVKQFERTSVWYLTLLHYSHAICFFLFNKKKTVGILQRF